jgi:hypothetical protein
MTVKLSALRSGLILIFVRGRVVLRAIMRLEGLSKFKNPITSSGIESAALRLTVYF